METLKKSLLKKYAKILEVLLYFSKNKKLKVASIIIRNGRIISSGYNGQLPGEKEKIITRHGHDISTVHAEQNALMNCCINGIETKGCIMMTSHFPCHICTKLAIMAGISKIYYINDYFNKSNPFRTKINIQKIR